MLYGAVVVVGLLTGEFVVQLTSQLASDSVISMFQSYAWQPPTDDPEIQSPSEMIAALKIAE